MPTMAAAMAVNTVSTQTMTAESGTGDLRPRVDADHADDICPFEKIHGAPPWQDGQEWANALTHAVAAAGTLVAGYFLILAAAPRGNGLVIACLVYAASVLGTFFFSTLSHFVRRQPMLNTMRAWDQGMIYAMISGTYTPIVYRYASETVQLPLLTVIWMVAAAGFLGKVAVFHRINSSGFISYLLLGWLPSIPLARHVPSELAWAMLAGGIVYSIGVIFLINDGRLKYLHAGWHISVMMAAAVHYLGILYFVVIA